MQREFALKKQGTRNFIYVYILTQVNLKKCLIITLHYFLLLRKGPNVYNKILCKEHVFT